MSAFAFTYCPNESGVIIMSDGLSMRDGKEVHSTTKKKVHRVNDSLSYVWLGNCPDGLLERIESQIEATGADTAEAVTEILSQVVETGLKYDSVKNEIPILAVVFGYGFDAKLKVYKIWSPDGPAPVREFLKPGQSGGISIAGGGMPEYERKLPALLEDEGGNLAVAGMKAFAATVKEMNEEGLPVGGEIYGVIVENPNSPHRTKH